MPRNTETLDRMFTARDREWLARIEQAINPKPQPVVSVETYCAAVAANDYITTQNRILRGQRKRLLKLLRVRSVDLREMRRMAIGAAVSAAVILLAMWMKGL